MDALLKNPMFSIAISAKRRPGQENNMNLSYPELVGTPGTGCFVKPDNAEMMSPASKSHSFYGSNRLYIENKKTAAGGSMFGLIYERDDQDNSLDRSGKLLPSPGASLQSRWFVKPPLGYKEHFDKFARIGAPTMCPEGKRPRAQAAQNPPLIDPTPVAFPKSPRPDGVAPAAQRTKFAQQMRKVKDRGKSRPASAAVSQYPWNPTRPTKRSENTVNNLRMWQESAPSVNHVPDVMVIKQS